MTDKYDFLRIDHDHGDPSSWLFTCACEERGYSAALRATSRARRPGLLTRLRTWLFDPPADGYLWERRP